MGRRRGGRGGGARGVGVRGLGLGARGLDLEEVYERVGDYQGSPRAVKSHANVEPTQCCVLLLLSLDHQDLTQKTTYAA